MQNGHTDGAEPPTLRKAQAGLQQLRVLLPAILALKQSPNPDAQQLTAAFMHASSLFIELRELHRSLCADIDNAKGDTAKAKAEFERIALLLQNLKYEEAYFIREISVCRDYKREADIPMISEQEFREQAPQELTQATDAHHLMTNRLTFEFKSRKALLQRVADLRAKKKAAQDAVDAKRKTLEGLNASVVSIAKAAAPVQSTFGLTHTTRAKQYALAQHLPAPLYLLFNHLKAYGDLFDKDCEVSLTGTSEAAINFKAELHRLTTTPITSLPSSQLYTEWPLSLQVELRAGPKDVLALVFRYFPALEVVSVAVNSPQYEKDALCALFPGDEGITSGANLRNLVALEDFRWDTNRPDRAYRWAQWLCGLYSPDAVAPSLSEAVGTRTIRKHLKPVIASIRKRMKVRNALQAQLDTLSKFQLPGVSPSPPYRVALSAWRRSAAADFDAAAAHNAPIPPAASLGLHFYRFTYTRDDEQLEGHVRVSGAYPLDAPRFALRYGGRVARKTGQLPERTLLDSDVATLETEVNGVSAPEDASLLTLQLRRLQAAYDRVLDERQKTLPSPSAVPAAAPAAAVTTPASANQTTAAAPEPMQQ